MEKQKRPLTSLLSPRGEAERGMRDLNHTAGEQTGSPLLCQEERGKGEELMTLHKE